jgi:hypothetical protein
MADTQPQDFDTHFQAFLVDLDGDGKPDATVQAPSRRSTPAEMVGGVPNYPEKFGPRLDEFNTQGVPIFDTPDQGDAFTLRYRGRRIAGIPDSLPSASDVGNLLMKGVNVGIETAAAAGAAGGPPGAILGNGIRAIRNLPATAGATAERIGQLFAGGRQARGEAAETLALTPQMAKTGFTRGNVTPAEMSAPWQRLPDDVGAQSPMTPQVWDAYKASEQAAARAARDAAAPTVSPQNLLTMSPSTGEFAQSLPPGAIRTPSQASALSGRMPQDQSFVWQRGGLVAESADPTLAAARQQALRQDQSRMSNVDIGSPPPARPPAQSIPSDAVADATVSAYLPQAGFRDMFARDPMRVIGDLEQATGVPPRDLLAAMERAGFDLSFFTRDKFMSRDGGRMTGYFAPGGKEAFSQIQQSPVLYRGRNMLMDGLKKPRSEN